MTCVSILIPASRPAYLDRALASALDQTFTDTEVLVGDDTPDGSLRAIVERFDDRRIRYFHHGFGHAVLNARRLWGHATGRYVKWLHDDDVLMPASVETLVAALRMHPDAAMAFHDRVVIDADDAVTETPAPLVPAGQVGQVSREMLAAEMVGGLHDVVGGFSNTMVVRERADAGCIHVFGPWELEALGHVGMCLALSAHAPVVVAGGYLSAARRHGEQRSTQWATRMAALYEWEVLVRAEAAAGHLSGEQVDAARHRLKTRYAMAGEPALAPLLAGLEALTRLPAQALASDPAFHAALASARAAVAGRRLVTGRPGTVSLPRKPIRLVVATRVAEKDFMTGTPLGRSLSLYRHRQPPQLLLSAMNRKGLPAVYNEAIDHAKTDPAILLFVHDDIVLCDFHWVDRLHEAIGHFDVVGLAGNRRRVPGQPAWCFPTLDGKWDERENLSGAVAHGKGFPSDNIAVYGPAGQACRLLDGLFLAADSTRLHEAGVRFDERFAFHFYDLDFCRQAEAQGLRMGTWAISVVHQSLGAYDSEGWREGYRRYMGKYGE